MKKLVIPVMLAAAAVAAWFGYHKMRPPVETGVIRISGNIEATTVEISFRIPGWVRSRHVDEGETVHAGQVVAMLDNAEYVSAVALQRGAVDQSAAALAKLEAGSRPEEITQAEAAMKQAEAYLVQLRAGSRTQEIIAAEEAFNAAKANAERLGTEYQRAASLYERKTISNQEYLAAKAAWEMAQAGQRESDARLKLVREGPRPEEILRAEAAWLQAKAGWELAKNGPRKEDIDQARAHLAQAREALILAETRLAYTTVVSPLRGVVLSKSTEPGEYVAPGTPIVTAADLRNVWLRGYVDEADVGKVKLGRKALVTTDSYPGKAYEGRISFIASEAEFTPKTVQTEKERVKLVFRVKIDLANPDQELKPGMPADAR